MKGVSLTLCLVAVTCWQTGCQALRQNDERLSLRDRYDNARPIEDENGIHVGGLVEHPQFLETDSGMLTLRQAFERSGGVRRDQEIEEIYARINGNQLQDTNSVYIPALGLNGLLGELVVKSNESLSFVHASQTSASRRSSIQTLETEQVGDRRPPDEIVLQVLNQRSVRLERPAGLTLTSVTDDLNRLLPNPIAPDGKFIILSRRNDRGGIDQFIYPFEIANAWFGVGAPGVDENESTQDLALDQPIPQMDNGVGNGDEPTPEPAANDPDMDATQGGSSNPGRGPKILNGDTVSLVLANQSPFIVERIIQRVAIERRIQQAQDQVDARRNSLVRQRELTPLDGSNVWSRLKLNSTTAMHQVNGFFSRIVH